MEYHEIPENVKQGVFHLLNCLPMEVDNLKQVLIDDKFDGNFYSGSSCCLVGTLCPHNKEAINNKATYNRSAQGLLVITPCGKFTVNIDNPAEEFVRAIRPYGNYYYGTFTIDRSNNKKMLLLQMIAEWDVYHRAVAVHNYEINKGKLDEPIVNGYVERDLNNPAVPAGNL